ncbi:MAG: translocation/assembly module TamB domain-containing protein, partial [Burkholderiales bacterium]
ELQLPAGRFAVHGQLSRQALDLNADIRDINLINLYSSLLPTRLSGSLRLSGSPEQPTLRLAVQDPRLAASGVLQLLPLKQGRQLRLQQLQLAAGSARAELNGSLDLAPRRAAQLGVRLQHFNPAAFGAFPVGELNGLVNLTGQLSERPDLLLRLAFDRSSLKGQALQANGQLRLVGDSVSQTDLRLALGAAQMNVIGALGRPGDQLQLQLEVPDFSKVLADWRGRASASVMLSGELRRPFADGSVQIQQLHGPDGLHAEQLQLQVNLPRIREAPAQIVLQGRDIGWGDLRVQQLSSKLNGTQQQHRLSADVSAEYQGKKQQLSLAATGAWQGGGGWQGQITQLASHGMLDVLLREPATLQLASRQVHLGPAELQLAGGVLKLQQTDWGPEGVVLQGSLADVQLAHILQASGASVPMQTDLRLSGEWQLTQTEGWRGLARLYRSSGDVLLERGDGSTLALALRQLELNLQAQAGKFNLDAKLLSRDYGKASGQLQWWPGSGEAVRPLALSVLFDMPSLSWLGPMLGPQMSVGGSMNGRVAADGVAGHLRWSGEMRADQLQLNNPDWGMNYKDGLLRATLDPSGIQIEKMQLRAGDGLLSGQGQLSFLQDVAAGQLKLTSDQFVAMNRPDMQLTISGDANARLADGKLDINGKLRADRGFFRFNGVGMPALSDDVVIVGAQQKKNGHQQKLPISLVLDVDLGKRLRFEGWGIRTGLTGAARVKSVHGQPLSVVGTVRSYEGRYTAYGQDLKITRGALAFQGALENPGLDVVAVRENLVVEPGIHLTGSLQSPRLTLIADTDMSEQEKLSWLILGKPPADGGQQKADADILIAAATALLSRDQSTSLQQQIAGRFGVDEIGLRSRSTTSVSEVNGASSTATQQVVAIGKRLSDKAYLVYEQGVDAASAAVKLTYTISRQWSVVAKAGQESQIDLFWNIWFD